MQQIFEGKKKECESTDGGGARAKEKKEKKEKAGEGEEGVAEKKERRTGRASGKPGGKGKRGKKGGSREEEEEEEEKEGAEEEGELIWEDEETELRRVVTPRVAGERKSKEERELDAHLAAAIRYLF
jgi:hypothetical protein